jgi:hypothetical protein
MTKKDLFRVLIKILGIYLLINVWITSLSVPFYILEEQITRLAIFNLLGLLLLESVLFLFVIFKTDLIIKWLKLDKGYDDEQVEMKHFNPGNILELGAIIVGGFLFADNIPVILSNLYVAFQSSVGQEMSNSISQTQPTFHIVITVIKLVIGYFLITRHKDVAKLLKDKNINQNSK